MRLVAVIFACAVVAAVDGAFGEAVGLVLFGLVVAWLVERGAGERPVPFRVWFPGGVWRR